MGLISVLLCRHQKRMMSNNCFLGVCTFVSSLVLLRNTKKAVYTHFLIDVCDNFLVSKHFPGFTRAHILFGLAGFIEEDARQICLTGHKHEEQDEKLRFFLCVSLFVGLFGLDSPSFAGYHMIFFPLHAPTRSHKSTFLLGPEIFMILGPNETVI